MQLSDLFLNRYLYKDNVQNSETKDSVFQSMDSTPTEPVPIPSGGAAQDINTGNVPINSDQLNGPIPQSTLDISNLGWTNTCVFSITDLDTVSWTAGVFTSANGVSYAISAGNTGNMSAKTYIYFNLATPTVYTATSSILTAFGVGKVLIATAENGASAATFSTVQATQIVGDNIAANTINANRIVSGSITATQLSATAIDAMTITGALIRTAAANARLEMSGASNLFRAYDTAGTLIMSVGAPSGNSIMRITPNSTTFEGIYITQAVASASARGLLLERTTGAAGASIYLISDSGSSGSVIDLINNGSGNSISIAANGAGSALSISSASTSNPAINISNSATQSSINISDTGNSTANASIYINRSNPGKHIELYTSLNSATDTFGLVFDLSNSGSGLEYAMKFTGQETVSSAVGGTQDKKIRIIIGATTYYIPCYTG